MQKVSIIVPIYNSSKYLSSCIDSLLNQTYKNLEIILIDDGSTDNSLNICNSYAKKDNRIIIKSINNSGVSTARNLGIDLATGMYMTFVDSDDWLEQNTLEFAIKKIEESESDIVIWSYFKNYLNNELELSLVPGGDQVFEKNKDALYLKSIYARYGEVGFSESVSVGTVMCKLYKKDLIINNNIKFNPDLIRAEDVIFTLNAFKHAKKISYFDQSLYHYRINDSSTTSGNRFIANTTKPFNTLLKELKTFINGSNLNNNQYNEALNARTVQVIRWHLEHNYFHDNYPKNLLLKRKEIVNLIKEPPYNNALKKVKPYMLPKKEKLMTYFFRYKLVLTFYFIYYLYENKTKSKSNKYD